MNDLENKSTVKRNYGIDLLKIISCFSVVILHEFELYINGSLAISNLQIRVASFIYYSGTFAIPFFFMINGFFLLNKKVLTFRYSLIKIKKIIFIILSWVFAFTLRDFLLHDEINFFEYLAGTFILGKSRYLTLVHFWFFWSLILLLLLAPILNRIMRQNLNYFFLIMIVLFCICFFLNIMNYIFRMPVEKFILEPFRIWTWLFYYMLGGLIGKKKEQLTVIISKYKALNNSMSLFMLFLIYVIFAMFSQYWIGSSYAEFNYNNFFVVLICILLFNKFLNFKLRGKIVVLIEKVVVSTMSIYILHPLILRNVEKIVGVGNIILMIINYFLTIIICYILFLLVSKIKYLRKIFIF